MDWSRRLRRQACAPLLRLLDRSGVRADHVTAAAFIAGLGFCGVYFVSLGWALGLLALHVCLDALDGPLAIRGEHRTAVRLRTRSATTWSSLRRRSR